jgi:hypothetical protein
MGEFYINACIHTYMNTNMNPQIHVLHKNKNKRYKKNLETHRGNLELREVEVRHGGQRNVEDDEEE